MEQLRFETVSAKAILGLGTQDAVIQRARVPGGWIVIYEQGKSVRFWPEPPCAAAFAAPKRAMAGGRTMADTAVA